MSSALLYDPAVVQSSGIQSFSHRVLALFDELRIDLMNPSLRLTKLTKSEGQWGISALSKFIWVMPSAGGPTDRRPAVAPTHCCP